jgi:hypothetical protein
MQLFGRSPVPLLLELESRVAEKLQAESAGPWSVVEGNASNGFADLS